MIQPESGYAKGPNGRIAYQVMGEGPIDLIFTRDPMVNLESATYARLQRTGARTQ